MQFIKRPKERGYAENIVLGISAKWASIVAAWGQKRIQPNHLMGIWGFQELRITGKCFHYIFIKNSWYELISPCSASLLGLTRLSRTTRAKRLQRRPRRESKVLHSGLIPSRIWVNALEITYNRSFSFHGTAAMAKCKRRVSRSSAKKNKMRGYWTDKRLNCLHRVWCSLKRCR